MTRLALTLMRGVAHLPLALVRAIGALLGTLLYALARERRDVVLTNLRLCFPDLHPAARAKLARAHFRVFAQSFVDRGLLWHAPPERLRALVTIENIEHLEAACASGRPVIVLAPHFIGLDAGWTRLSLDRQLLSMYANQKNPLFNQAMKNGRLRFNQPQLLSRQEGIRSALKAMKGGLPFYYLPDMDFGPRDAMFVPFFGVPAATITSFARIAALAQAVVVPAITRLTPDGYVLRFDTPWLDFPGDDVATATRRQNAYIEDQVRLIPEQYLWLHKRFKTRPPGMPRVYKRR